ncbi:hypothetical protein H9660_15045, partial [Clostridium sp. Sa3CUN1]
MRSRAAIKNTIYSLMSYSIIVLIGFIAQRVFLNILGKEYLGIHSLFSNVVTMLAIVELGFGSAVITNLYRPVALNDYKLINNLLSFYKKVYRFMASIVFILGILIMPFIDKIVGETLLNINFKFIFLFYLIDTVSSYLLSYKRSIIYAYQKAYIINIVHTIMIILMNILQVVILIYTSNFYLYLIIKVLCRIGENIIINSIVNKNYSFLDDNSKDNLPSEIKDDILKKVKGLIFHKIGTFVVCGTDNIIISMLPGLGIVWVGLYSNYLLIINQLSSIISQIFSSLTASVGNLVIEEDSKKSYKIFKCILLINSFIYTYAAISMFFISKPFIKLWIGEEYLFKDYVVLALVINFYLNGMRNSYALFKDASGIFYEDRMVPIIESIVNLFISLIAGYFFGIIGVFIGTICSNLVLFLYSFPKYVYKRIFERNMKEYFKELGYYFGLYI